MCLYYLWTLHDSFFFLKVEFMDILSVNTWKRTYWDSVDVRIKMTFVLMYSFVLFCVKNSPSSLFLGLEILCTGLQSCNIYDNLPDDSKSDSGDFLGAFFDGTDKQDII